MTRRSTRAWAAAALTGGALLASTGPANAQLGLPLGSVGQIVTDVGTTVGGVLPVGGGVVTGVTGTVGGIVTGATGTVTGVVDDVLAGGGGGLLSGGALDSLLGTLGVVPGGVGGVGGAGGAGGPAGSVVGGSGSGVIDARSPNVKFTVLSRLSRIAKTGRIPVRVSTDEAGIVAFRGSVRPGKALKKSRTARRAAAAKPIKFPSAVLAYRKAGALRVTISS